MTVSKCTNCGHERELHAPEGRHRCYHSEVVLTGKQERVTLCPAPDAKHTCSSGGCNYHHHDDRCYTTRPEEKVVRCQCTGFDDTPESVRVAQAAIDARRCQWCGHEERFHANENKDPMRRCRKNLHTEDSRYVDGFLCHTCRGYTPRVEFARAPLSYMPKGTGERLGLPTQDWKSAAKEEAAVRESDEALAQLEREFTARHKGVRPLPPSNPLATSAEINAWYELHEKEESK